MIVTTIVPPKWRIINRLTFPNQTQSEKFGEMANEFEMKYTEQLWLIIELTNMVTPTTNVL
jgi:hypothetical protein